MLKTTLLFGLAHSNRVLVARFGDVKQHNPVQSKKALAHIIAQSQRRQSKMRIKSEKERSGSRISVPKLGIREGQ